MTFCIYSLHAKPTQLIDGGYQLAPGTTIKLGEPLATFETFDEAEEWRVTSLLRIQSDIKSE